MSTNEMESTARTYRQIQADIKTLEEQADALRQQMIGEMDARQTEELATGAFTIRWKLYESGRLDTAKLRADHGGLCDAYTVRTVATRFSVA